MKSNVAGKPGTGQCDGWKSNARASIINCIISLVSVCIVLGRDPNPEVRVLIMAQHNADAYKGNNTFVVLHPR
jgi:hypothetical protein